MNPLKHIMKSALYLLPWLGLPALTGCSWEEDPATCLPETTSLQVTVSARQEGDLNSRADENAKDGEFMHDLCVLFVQGNTVKLKLQPDLSGDASAQEGNLQAWTSGEQKGLEAGTYTVYAFANISDHYGKWNVGSELSGDALPENIVIEDPAGNLDFENGKFIPMSAKEEVSITAATRSVSIGLDRLVAKVRMKVGTTSQEPVTVKNVTFSGYADKVSLIPNASISTLLRDKKYEYTEEFQISASQDKNIPDFYVNETRQGDPFTISVTTTENQGVTYLATTTRTDLPRNSIYPLTLNLNNFGIEITPTAWLKVTGVPYNVYYTPVSENTYRIEMATGSYFSLTPQSVMAEDGTSISNDVSWSWTIPSDLPTGYVATSNGNVAEGHFPSGGEKYYDDFSLQLNAQWTYNGVNYNRAYTFIIDVCYDEVWAMSHRTQNNANSRATDNSNWLIPEFLNMYKIR